MNSSRTALVASTLLGTGALTFCLLVVRVPRTDSGPVPDPSPEGDRNTAGPLQPGVRETARAGETVALPQSSLESVLQEYWGDEWDSVKGSYQKERLQEPFVLKPWEEVEPRIRKNLTVAKETRAAFVEGYVSWPTALSSEWLKDNYGFPGDVDEATLSEIDLLVQQENQAIRDAAEGLVDQMDTTILSMLDSGRVVRVPADTSVVAKQPWEEGICFHSAGTTAGGWCVRIGLSLDYWPDLAERIDEIERMQDKRDEKVQGRLRRRH